MLRRVADDGEKRHEEIDYHKHDQLRKQKDGKGHWVKELSSNSEAAVCPFFPPLPSFLVLWSFVACDPRPGRKGERGGAGFIDLGEMEIIVV